MKGTRRLWSIIKIRKHCEVLNRYENREDAPPNDDEGTMMIREV